MERNISEGLLVELWSRISLKKVFTMKLVSKHWATLIDSSKNFIASRQPRILYTYVNGLRIRKFRSFPQDDNKSMDGARKERAEFRAGIEVSSPPVNGLICLRSDESTRCNVDICNFFTGKCVRLPELQKKVGEETSLFFGWDPIHHLFKVLCVRVEKKLGEVLVMPQIFSLKGQSSSWRGISCAAYPHLPIDSEPGMCKDGVIYYGAWNMNREVFVMSFNLKSEVFTPIYLGEVIKEVDKMRIQMMDYKGHVSLVIRRPLPQSFFINRKVVPGSGGFRFDIRTMKNGQGGWDCNYVITCDSIQYHKPLFWKAPGHVVFDEGPLYIIHTTGRSVDSESDVRVQFRFYQPNQEKELSPSYHYCKLDHFRDRFERNMHLLDVQNFLGTVSFINPEELLE